MKYRDSLNLYPEKWNLLSLHISSLETFEESKDSLSTENHLLSFTPALW